MDKELYFDILDQKRTDLLPLLKPFKDNFYLAGGTALALLLGHRDSFDFDFFSPGSFSTEDLFRKGEQVFAGHHVVRTQEANDTLTIVIDESTKVSFFAYPYELVRPLLDEDYFRIASIEDIACMKLSAITSRSVLKDYVDLYFILHNVALGKLLNFTKEKFYTIDANIILKSLVYFEDIQEEPILFKHNKEVSFKLVKEYIAKTVKEYLTEVNK
jgi:predicted nucleotidyltransferase component of viral defense system